MGKISLTWVLLGLVDLATLAAGSVLWTGYQYTWGLPVAFLGLAGLVLAVYEILRKDEAEEEQLELELKE